MDALEFWIPLFVLGLRPSVTSIKLQMIIEIPVKIYSAFMSFVIHEHW